MNSFAVVATVIAWLLFLNTQPQNPSVSEKWLLLEKRALAVTQRLLASDLDTELPRLSFADWFEKVVGPRAGVIWQLSECGERAEALPNATSDMRACVEANATFPDGRRVILMVAVGTFKRGMAGAPTFYFGVIERGGGVYLVRRLRDLPRQLSTPPGSLANKPAVKLPDADIPKAGLVANNTPVALLEAWSDGELGQATTIEAPPPPQAPGRPKAASTGEGLEAPGDGLKVLGAVLWGGVIKKAQPRYPPSAKRFNISGPVDVQVTISEAGSVIEAKAISGHPLLRGAAEKAARQWAFKPATLSGVPVETQIVLTFVFKVPQ
jgi:periplasmic protein TonB